MEVLLPRTVKKDENLIPGWPARPANLSERAAREWDRLAEELASSGIQITTAHRSTMEIAATIAAPFLRRYTGGNVNHLKNHYQRGPAKPTPNTETVESGVIVDLTAASDDERMLYDRKSAALQLSISVRSLDYLIAGKRIGTRRIGKKVLIPRSELTRFARSDHPEPVS